MVRFSVPYHKMDGFRAPAELENPADWPKWKQSFEFFLEATERTEKSDNVKIGALLTCLGKKYLDVYNNFVWSEAEIKAKTNATYAAVLEKFSTHFEPQRNSVYERHKFFTRRQKTGETIDEFLTSLQTLASLCDFHADEKEKLIRDMLILGLNDPSSIEHLLREAKLTLAKATTFLRAKELSEKQTKIIVGESTSSEKKVDDPAKIDALRSRRTCYKCNTSHPPRSCPAYGEKCNFCKGPNHFEKACRLRRSAQKKKNTDKNRRKKKNLYAVNIEDSDSDLSSDSDTLHFDSLQLASVYEDTARSKRSKAWYQNIEINGKPVKFKLDPGSEVTTIPKELFKKLKLSDQPLKNSSKILEPYMSSGLKLDGTIKLRCTYKNRSILEKIYVVSNNKKTTSEAIPLLGITACENLGLVKRTDSVNFKKKEEIFTSFRDVFE